MAQRSHYSISALAGAARGDALPSPAVLAAYVKACDRDPAPWLERLANLAGEVNTAPEKPTRTDDRPEGASPPTPMPTPTPTPVPAAVPAEAERTAHTPPARAARVRYAALGCIVGLLAGAAATAGLLPHRPSLVPAPPNSPPFFAKWNPASGPAGAGTFTLDPYMRTKSDPGPVTIDLVEGPGDPTCFQLVDADGVQPLSGVVCVAKGETRTIAPDLAKGTKFHVRAKSDQSGQYHCWMYY